MNKKEYNRNWMRNWRKNNREEDLRRKKKYRETHKEKIRKYTKEWNRQNPMIINGKYVMVRKRSFLGKCEICNKIINSRPQWHHWNDEHLEWGLWLYFNCHRGVEAYEKFPGIIKKYVHLKSLIESNQKGEVVKYNV